MEQRMEMARQQEEYFYGMLTEEEKSLFRYMPTVNELLSFAVEHYGSRPAISDGKNTYSYEELARRVAVRRGSLRARGLKAGDRVAVLAPNTTDAMELYLAITTGGYVSVMLPAALPAPAVSGLCRKFGVSLLCCDRALEETAAATGIPTALTDYALWEGEEAPMAQLSGDTLCSICLTGGTTGTPKGAMMSHHAMMRGAYNGCFMPGGVLHESYIALLPLSHIFGLVKGFLSVLYTGSLVYGCRDVKEGLGLLPVLKPTTLVVVPGMAEIIVNLTRLKGRGYSASLKALITGAAPVPVKLMKELDALGIRVLAGYGLTEGANLSSGNQDVLARPESMGMVYPGQSCRVVDGELRIRGDNLMEGYYGDEEATKAAFDEEGWLRTGDLARFDEEGFIYITGRIKNIIVLPNGENISPEQLEEIFYKDPHVKDCLVREDESRGRTVLAIEFLPDPAAVKGMDEAQQEELFRGITARVNQELPGYAQLSRVIVRKEDFKRTPAMKIARN